MEIDLETMKVYSKTLVGLSFGNGGPILELNLITQRGSETSILEVLRDGVSVGRIEGVLSPEEVEGLRKLDTYKAVIN